MIQRQLKLRLTSQQERQLTEWLWHLTGVWNWAIRKLELDAQDDVYYSPNGFRNLLANHGKTLGIPSHTLQGMLSTAYTAWQRCYQKLAKKPKLKGQRNKLTSIPFPDPFKAPDGTRIHVPGLGHVRFHAQDIPGGRIKSGRIVKRASGWYLCLCIDAQPRAIPHTGDGAIGIDPGFHHLLTLSSGEKIPHPHELRQTEQRLAQAQRGGRKHLVARLHERLAQQRKDRNHKLSRRLVAENQTIVWSTDSNRGIAKTFGKSVTSAGHARLRGMLAYKCTASGRQFLEVPSKYSTKTCSACRSLSGPTGYAGLQVRHMYAIEHFLEETGQADLEVDREWLLRSWRLILGEHPTLAGIVLFGRNPQRELPFAQINAARIPGTDIANDPLDRKDLTGQLLTVIDDATRFLRLHLKIPHTIKGFEPEAHPELPEAALREAIVNAVAHRDYTIKGPVRLFIFDDRIAIHTPGRPPNTVDAEAMRFGVHVVRNPHIYARLSDAGLVTRAGSGIPRMIRLVRQATGKDIDITIRSFETLLTIPRKADERTDRR